MDAWEKFKKTVEQNRLVQPGDTVLVAVSGGPDSVSLLHLFKRLSRCMPLDLHAVYCDHQLRKQSVREAKMVAGLGEKYGIPVAVETIPVSSYAAAHGLSVETAGRELRYKAFERLAVELGASVIATGHTANDNAETVLMWLVRGTGTEGLSGIPLSRRVSGTCRIIRPLLSVTRPEVESYVRRQKLRHSIDASNYSLAYTRNKVRHQVLPLLETYNPRAVEHISSLARILAEENEFLSLSVLKALRATATISKTRISLDLKRFLRYNRVIQARLLKALLPEKRSRIHIERFLQWISSSSARELEFSRTWLAEKRGSSIVLKKRV